MKQFIDKVYADQKALHKIPPQKKVHQFIDDLYDFFFLFEDKTKHKLTTDYKKIEKELAEIILALDVYSSAEINTIVEKFFESLPTIYSYLLLDLDAIVTYDPAASSKEEVIASYPGLYAILVYRFAHQLQISKVPIIPRMMTELAHTRTGVDIHPGAVIGSGFFIDHGTGIVIGETTKIGHGVRIYQGVTLGALAVKKELAQKKRHPTVEDKVVIYANAIILGGATVIGNNSIIGGNSFIVQSIAPYSIVSPEKNQIKVIQQHALKEEEDSLISFSYEI